MSTAGQRIMFRKGAVVDGTEQVRLGHDGLFKVSQVQGLVGAVRPGVGIFNTRDKDLRARVDFLQVRNEGNGAAHSRFNGGNPP